MAAKQLDTPKLRRAHQRGKITTYPDFETQRLYEMGKANGWDTAAIVREAITQALGARKEQLLKPAEQSV